MKKIVLLLGLFITLPSFAANWTHIGSYGNATYYYNANSVSRELGNPKAWILANYKKPGHLRGPAGEPIKSIKMLNVFLCSSRKWAAPVTNGYSGAMGGGSLLLTENAGSWPSIEIEPDSAVEMVYGVFCR